MSYPKRTQYKYAKSPYRVSNWHAYDAGLRRRGDLTIWFSQDAIDASIPGDTIGVSEGYYFQRLTFKNHSGLPGQPITLTAQAGHEVVFDHSYPPLTVAPNALWAPEPAVAQGAYSTPFLD